MFWPAEKCRISSDISVQLISCLIQNLTGANTAGLVIPELIRALFGANIRQRSNHATGKNRAMRTSRKARSTWAATSSPRTAR